MGSTHIKYYCTSQTLDSNVILQTLYTKQQQLLVLFVRNV